MLYWQLVCKNWSITGCFKKEGGKMSRKALVLLGITLLFFFVACFYGREIKVSAQDTENLVRNGDFEIEGDTEGVARFWIPEVRRRDTEGGFWLDSEEKTQGKYSQRVDQDSAGKGFIRVNQDNIPAEPNSLYEFRAMVKSTGTYTIAVFEFFRDKEGNKINLIHSGIAQDWREIRKTIETTADAKDFRISLIVGTQGSAWFDEVELRKIK